MTEKNGRSALDGAAGRHDFIYKYSLADDSDYPVSDSDYTDAKYLYDAFVLPGDGSGEFSMKERFFLLLEEVDVVKPHYLDL